MSKMENTISKLFFKKKQQILNKLEAPQLCDKSVKGGVDAPIADLIELINSLNPYISTSSCSGRISIFAAANENSNSKQKGTGWLFITHDPINIDQFNFEELNDKIKGDFLESELISFKFEPFIIHVQCKSIGDGQDLLQLALEAGYRNSGMIIGKKNINVAIRSTIQLDAPIASKGNLLVNEDYIKLLIKLSNQKFEENEKRIKRLFDTIKNKKGNNVNNKNNNDNNDNSNIIINDNQEISDQ